MIRLSFFSSSSLPFERKLFSASSAPNSLVDEGFLLPNALRRRKNPSWTTGFSLGVDLGNSRTGLALGKGLTPPRPLIVGNKEIFFHRHSIILKVIYGQVLEMRGQKLETRIMEIAGREV